MTEDYFRGLNEITTTAASFRVNEDRVKFRLMVEKHTSQEEATAMFNNILHNFEQVSNSPEYWNQYNGFFDIKSHDNGVIYEATKAIGEDLKVTSK